MKAAGLAPLRKGCERLPSVSVWVLSAMARFRRLITTVDPFAILVCPVDQTGKNLDAATKANTRDFLSHILWPFWIGNFAT